MSNTIKKFTKICKLPQDMLKKYLECRLKTAGYKEIINRDGFLYARGDIPYLLTAHMDTVHKVTCKDYKVEYFKNKTKIWSKDGIGGDDRCGVYMILDIINEFKPSILFCEDEEIGGIGSRKFCASKFIDELKDMNYLIELDRANSNDAVFYDCDNEEFTQFILDNTGYKEAFGSYSDISELSPECKIASVNLSCGYYNAHTNAEHVIIEEMERTIEVVKKLLAIEDCEQFEYIEKALPSYYGYYGYARNYNYDYDYGYNYGYYGTNTSRYDEINGIEVTYIDSKTGKQHIEFGYGKTEDEAMLDFFLTFKDVCYNDIIDYDAF